MQEDQALAICFDRKALDNVTDQDQQVDVLAVFSHPDDAELTVAGTLLKLKSLGYRTGVCDMTRGEMGTRGDLGDDSAEHAVHVLREDDEAAQPDVVARALEHGGARLVAARLDAEDDTRT